MKTRLLLFSCLLLALALLAGCAAREAPSAPAEATARIDGAVTAEPAPPPEASDEPAAEATGEPTPCPHENWENGVCAACGERCAHPAHDAETRLCSVCGEAVPHSYVGGFCTRCGAAPVFETVCVPRELFEPCEHAGTVELLSYVTEDYRINTVGDDRLALKKQMAVYLPYGYDPSEKYDVLILMHGLYGSERYWLVDLQDYFYPYQDYVSTANLIDHMMDSAACRKMIIAAPTFYRDSRNSNDFFRGLDQVSFTRELRESILPALISQYSTWAENGSPETIASVREHFAYAGLSMGSMYAYTSILPDCLDLFGWFGCFSGSDGDMPALADELNGGLLSEYPICFFYNSIGTNDSFYSLHWNQYHDLVWRCDGLTEGENAAFTELDELGHTYTAWSIGLYNFLPLLFPLDGGELGQ